MRITRRIIALATPAVLAAALSAAAGPPWIGIEYPVNPHDPDTRGALVVVHTYHHEAPVPSAMRAEAIGTVDGRRVRASLEVGETARRGVYAVRGEIPGPGAWVIRVARGTGPDALTALIAMNEDREVLAIRVPTDAVEGGRWIVPRSPSDDEVALLLRTASAMNDAARSARLAAGAGAALLLLVLAPAGVWLGRRSGGPATASRPASWRPNEHAAPAPER